MTTDEKLYTLGISLFFAGLIIVWLNERGKDRRREQQREADRLSDKWRNEDETD